MLVPHTFRPHHLALAIALTMGWTGVSTAQQPDIQIVETAVEDKPKKPRKKTVKPPVDSNALATTQEVISQLPPSEPLAPPPDVLPQDQMSMIARVNDDAVTTSLLFDAVGGGEIVESDNPTGMRIAQGAWTLAHEFTGDTDVDAGAVLYNNGAIVGKVRVDEGAVYAGFGKTGSLHVTGFLLATPKHGAPQIRGDLTFDKNATFVYGVSATEYSDPVYVEGTATLADAKVQIDSMPGDYAESNRYALLSAGVIDGTFGEVTTNLAYMTPTLSYDEQTVSLNYARNDIPLEKFAASTSGQAMAKSMDTPGAPTANTAVTALTHSTAKTATHAIEQLAAGSNANLAKATLSSVTPVSASMLSAMRQLNSRAGSAYGSGNSPRQMSGSADSGRVWIQALGHGGKVDRDFDSSLKHATQGLVMGADWRLDEQWHIGLAGGKSQTKLDARQYDGDLDSWHVGAYAVRQDGPLALRLGATYASHAGSSKRQVAFNGFSDRLKGDYNANTQQAFAELGFNLGRNNVTLEPFASLGYQRYQRDSYNEKGGDAALKVFGQNQNNLSSTFGLRTAKINRLDNGMSLTPRLSAGWKHLYGELESDTNQQLAKGGKRFAVTGAELDRNSLAVDAGLDLGLSSNHTLGIGITGEFGTESRNHGVMGQWRMAF